MLEDIVTKKEEAPEHIKKFYRLDKKVDKLRDTHKVEHSRAYNVATEVLRDTDGYVDYDKLEDSKVQEDFVKKMTDHYLSKAKETFKGASPKDEVEEDMLLRAYADVTRAELLRAVRTHGKKYTVDAHKELSDDIVKRIEQRLRPTAYAHLKQEYIDDIIKYTKADDVIKKELLEPEHGMLLLKLYQQFGTISPEIVSEHPNLGKRYLKKKAA